MTIIARAYETEQQASEAISALIANGVDEDRIQMVHPNSNQSTASDGLRAGQALGQHSNAESYAKALEKGQTVVIADAHFGKGMALSTIMDSYKPVPLEQSADIEDAYDSSTPFSYMMGMSVLMRNNPAPFSTMFGFSIESKGRSSLRRWFGGELSSSATPISNMFGLPALSEKGGAFFSKFGLRELSSQTTYGDSSFGKPLLMDNATPLSDKMGRGCLSDNPTPLSSKLGLKVLTTERNKTPTSPIASSD